MLLGRRRPPDRRLVARSAYRVLRAIFNTAIQDDLMIKNPCRVKGAGTDRSAERRPRRLSRWPS